MLHTDGLIHDRSGRPVLNQAPLCQTPSGHKFVRITRHAIERCCERKGVAPQEAQRRILTLAQNGEVGITPSGPVLRVGTEYIGFEPVAGQPGAIVIVTYYPLTNRRALRRYYAGIRPRGLGAKPGPHPISNSYATKRRFAYKFARAKRDDRDGPPHGKPYVRQRRKSLADYEEEWCSRAWVLPFASPKVNLRQDEAKAEMLGSAR
jgi:hypothetical protein